MVFNETPTTPKLENTMFKLYQKSQTIQNNLIRNHPAQWITLNVTLAMVPIVYIMFKERQDERKLENEVAQQEK
jgi:hypothetical protein